MKNGLHLPLERCPHCSVAKPLLSRQWGTQSPDQSGKGANTWTVYQCTTCGSMVLTVAPYFGSDQNPEVFQIWPSPALIPETIPNRARDYLSQAVASLHAPAGAVILAASSVDAMLKEKGFKEGTLNTKIDTAAKKHLITNEMATWAHEVRLDANDQRHADESAPLPTVEDAQKVIEFAHALAQFLFVLPARVERGRQGMVVPNKP